jgi:CRP/FNR family transcriptional regulator
VCRAAETDSPAFQQLLHRFFYQARQVVFYEGHPSLGLYVLCAGKAKLTSSSASGHQRIMGIVGAGTLIERSGFCEGALHAVTCETLEPSQVCLVDRQGYFSLLEKNPPLAIDLLQMVSRDTLRSKLPDDRFPFRKSAERFAMLLLDLGKRFGTRKPEGVRLELRLTREELAELTGTAPETVIRLLSRFKRQQLVATNGSEITLLKPERLGQIARLPS